MNEKPKEKGKQVFQNNNLLSDYQILCDRAKKDNAIVVDRTQLGKEKISVILAEMIKPELYTAQDEEDLQGKISMGVAAWNCGIIKQTLGEDKLQHFLQSFNSNATSEERTLLYKYIIIKINRYGQYNDLITDFQISLERDGRMNLSVVTSISG